MAMVITLTVLATFDYDAHAGWEGYQGLVTLFSNSAAPAVLCLLLAAQVATFPRAGPQEKGDEGQRAQKMAMDTATVSQSGKASRVAV